MKFILLIYFLIISSSAFSQRENKSSHFFLELNVLRYAEYAGMFKGYQNELQFEALNGIKLGIKSNNITEYYLSLSCLASSKEIYYTSTGEFYNWEGLQLGLGMNKLFYSKKGFSLQYGGEMLFQRIRYNGEYWTDYGVFSVNKIKTNEFGLASVFQVTYKLYKRIEILANTRFGFYYRINSGDEYFGWSSHYNLLREPLNSLGIRIDI